jgi:hypothetical protein
MDEISISPFLEFSHISSLLSLSFFLDRKTGDLVCQMCGHVSMERVISEEAEYRVFSEGNSKNRIHYGAAHYNWLPFRTNTTSRSDRDSHEFLWNGFRNIEEVLMKLQRGYATNKPVEVLFLFEWFHFSTYNKKRVSFLQYFVDTFC